MIRDFETNPLTLVFPLTSGVLKLGIRKFQVGLRIENWIGKNENPSNYPESERLATLNFPKVWPIPKNFEIGSW